MTAAGEDRPGARLLLDRVSRGHGSTPAVREALLELAPGSFTALLGPSGCGKSTLLHLVAGLLTPETGDVVLDDASMVPVAAERRPVGLVFQKPLLFPHLSVEANVAFGLRMRRVPRRRARDAARQMLDRVHLLGHAGRKVGQLSGGQEQRVALARALVLSPRLLLLDEPFSQLDPELRGEMRTLVRELAEETKVTTLFVTHDQAEAVDVADDIALMLDGRIVGHASPERFYRQPPSVVAARFFGVTNEIVGTVVTGRFRAPGLEYGPGVDLPDGEAVLVVRPEALRLAEERETPQAPPPGLRATGVLVGARFAGSHQRVELSLNGGRGLTVHRPVHEPVRPGAVVTVAADAEACTVFPSPRPPAP